MKNWKKMWTYIEKKKEYKNLCKTCIYNDRMTWIQSIGISLWFKFPFTTTFTYIMPFFLQNDTILERYRAVLFRRIFLGTDCANIYVSLPPNSPSWVAYTFRKFELTRAMRYMSVHTYVYLVPEPQDAPLSVYAFSRKHLITLHKFFDVNYTLFT